MEILRKDVLASLYAAPQRKMLDLSKLPCTAVAQGMKASKTGLGSRKPEAEAVEFYALNHLVAHLQTVYTPHEPLAHDDAVMVGRYLKCLTEQTRRMYTYLHLIITREARHASGGSGSFYSKIGNPSLVDFHKSILGLSEGGAIQRFIDEPPQASLGQYTQMIRDAFYHLSWSSGFGGKAWGNIADCALRFVKGEASAEIMVDTAYTLAHNNGPIFNKGMVYDHYNATALREILDVQRSGQMPEYVLEAFHAHSADLNTLIAGFKERHPGAIGGYVDWYKVEDLGALGKYPKQKAAQAGQHGKTVTTPTGSKVHEKGSFYVDPKLSLPIITRIKKAA